MILKKKAKGEWGYINSQRKRVMLITLVLYVCAVGILLFGLKTMHTTQNIWTIIAVLSFLPASKSMVNLIMFLRFKSLDREIYKKYSDNSGDMPLLYETPFTTYEKTFFVEAAACRNNSIAVCYPGKPGKNKSHDQDMNNLKDHLSGVLKNDGYADCTVKIYDDRDMFIERLKDMQKGSRVKDKGRDEGIMTTLKSVGL